MRTFLKNKRIINLIVCYLSHLSPFSATYNNVTHSPSDTIRAHYHQRCTQSFTIIINSANPNLIDPSFIKLPIHLSNHFNNQHWHGVWEKKQKHPRIPKRLLSENSGCKSFHARSGFPRPTLEPLQCWKRLFSLSLWPAHENWWQLRGYQIICGRLSTAPHIWYIFWATLIGLRSDRFIWSFSAGFALARKLLSRSRLAGQAFWDKDVNLGLVHESWFDDTRRGNWFSLRCWEHSLTKLGAPLA